MRERKDHFFGTSRAPRYVHELDLALVERNPDQPRKHFDEEKLRELAASIQRHGLLQPIVVRKLADSDKYLIVAGERRYRAFQILARPTIDAIIFEGEPETEELSLIENLQRENLNPIEEAEALSGLQRKHGYSQEELADVVGKARNTVNEILRLTALSEAIKAECRSTDAVPRQVLVEIARAGDEEEQLRFWAQIKSSGATTLRAVRAQKPARKSGSGRTKPSEVAATISLGRGFASRLDKISDDYLSANQADYAALMNLVRSLAARMEAVRNLIGEPIEVEAQERPAE